MPVLEVKTAWYTLARQATQRPAEELKNVYGLCRAQLCSLRKIARLHPTIGEVCDEVRAPLDVVRRIAHAPGAAEQWERARQLLADLVDRRTRQGRAGLMERQWLDKLAREPGTEAPATPESSRAGGRVLCTDDEASAVAEASDEGEQREQLSGVFVRLLDGPQRGELAQDLARVFTQ